MKNHHLGVSDEGDADGEFPLHPPRQGLGASVALVLQAQDANDAVHLARDLFPAVTFQLDVQTRSSRQTTSSSLKGLWCEENIRAPGRRRAGAP